MYRICFSTCQLNGCFFAVAFVITTLMTGCGGGDVDNTPKGKVAGKVLVGSEPFATGSIHLTSAKAAGKAYGAEMKAEGAFEIAAPIPVGSYKVSLSPPSMGPVKGADGQMRPPTAKEMKNNVPKKYRSAGTSDKTVEVKEGDNELTIELKP